MFKDKSIPPQFEAVKDPDEQIYWTGHPVLIPFLASGIPFLIFGLFWGAFDYFLIIRNMGMGDSGSLIIFTVLHSFPFWASILNMIYLILVYGNTCYAFTNKRLMMRTGFMGTDFKAIDYDKLLDIVVSVNPIEKLFGVGTIQAFSASFRGRIYDKFSAIQNPYEVFKKIKEISVNIKTDWNYPNAMRPAENPGYRTNYNPEQGQ